MNTGNSKLSSKLKQLRFMQRASKKEEQGEDAEEQTGAKSVPPGGDGLGQSQSGWIAQASKKMCVVLRTSDPAPMGLGGGKMSFGKKKEPIDVEKEQEDAVISGLCDVSKSAAVTNSGKKRKQQEAKAKNTTEMTRPNDAYGKKSKHKKKAKN